MHPHRFDRRRVIASAGGALSAGTLAWRAPVLAGQPAGPATPVATPAAPGDILVTTPDLAAALDENAPPLVVALTDPDQWAAGDIPGARQIDWPDLELGTTTPDAIAAWSETTRQMLSGLGIAPSSDVVIYDGGSLFAARLWWILDHFGHDRNRVLDGGLPAWSAADQPVDAGGGNGTGSATTPVADPYLDDADATRLATKDEVLTTLGDPGVVLVDARGPEEYAAGHIPGAVMVPYPTNALPDDPKTFLSPAELVALYAAAGVTPDRRVIPYCSTGVRSAVTYQALRLAGYPDVALYTGSWAEWSTDPSAPIETGH